MRVLSNAAKCLACGDELVSTEKNKPVSCSCGNVTIRGGNSYLRHSVRMYNYYQNLSQVEKVPGIPAIHFHGDGFTKTSV